MIEISDLVKYYGDVAAVDHISFKVQKGEILGFLGPNGAGKTTTMNILTGYISATSGKVTINGHDILEEPASAKKAIGYLPEQPPLYLDMTVLEYLKFVSELKNVPKKERIRRIAEIMYITRIADVADRVIHNLSKGYRQRVGIAQALIGDPEVLVLDEPTVGLDPNQIAETRNLIKTLGKNHTIILSTHILSEVQALCDRVVIISGGRIAAVDTLNGLSQSLSGISRLLLTFEGPMRETSEKIRALPGVKEVAAVKESRHVQQIEISFDSRTDIRKTVFFLMAGHSWPILEFRSLEPSLEEIFLKITASDEKKWRKTDK